ncbi:hypothetical protein I7I51_04079 [Histoplasma capsulatum]|uniref:Uncharacterized protein n=1 Tax=Ajellomyces capsulatus TaxID=5037 RepID=A0A8A1MBN0_AJECA|nr:hypothetical protein I7I51_04079 [Histoplasma capsulatum]
MYMTNCSVARPSLPIGLVDPDQMYPLTFLRVRNSTKSATKPVRSFPLSNIPDSETWLQTCCVN